MSLSESDKSLITSLAAALHACVSVHDKEDLWRFRDSPLGWRIYSEVCATLWKLGLTRIKNGDSGYCMDFHKYVGAPEMIQIASKISMNGYYQAELVSTDAIDQAINFSNWDEHLNFQTLIEQFVLCMSQLGVTETIPVSRKFSFEIQDYILTSAMNELVEHGFAVHHGSQYQWTDKITVHMISKYLWTQDEVIETKVEPDFIANSMEKLVSIALNKIPYYSRGNISTYTSLGMSIALVEHWDGSIWHDNVLSSPAISFENAMGIAKGFLNIYSPSRSLQDIKWVEKEHKTLSENDKRLVFALVKILYRRWDLSILAQENNEELVQGYAHHGCTGVFESSAHTLWILRLAQAAWPNQNLYDITYERYEAFYKNPQNLGAIPCIKLVPKNNIDEFISFEDFYPNLSVIEVLKNFLELASDYGGKLPVARGKNFQAPDSELERTLSVLVERGYATKKGLDYTWTDKIAAAMISNFDWKEEDFEPSKVNSNVVKQTVAKILNLGISQIPRGFFDGYLGQDSNSTMGLTFGILQYWSGTNWSQDPLPNPLLSMDNALVVARDILKQYKHNEDYKNHHWVKV